MARGHLHLPPAPAAARHCRAVPQPYTVPEPHAWPQPFVPPGRGSGVFAFRAQLGVASPLPPAHGYSCRQQPITMASGLPAGTACPFPSLCSQEAACAVRVPCAGLRWHLARPDGSWGAFAMGPGQHLPPLQPRCHAPGPVQLRHGAGGGAGCPHPAAGGGHPSVREHSLAQPEQAGWDRGVSAPHFWPQWHHGVGSQDQDP